MNEYLMHALHTSLLVAGSALLLSDPVQLPLQLAIRTTIPSFDDLAAVPVLSCAAKPTGLAAYLAAVGLALGGSDGPIAAPSSRIE
jgi:hypothetical protein